MGQSFLLNELYGEPCLAFGWLAAERARGKIAGRQFTAWLETCVRSDQLGREVPDSLKSLSGIFIDCGWRDQYHIHYGARIPSKRLAAAGIRHTYEEFDDDHSYVDYRMDASLPFLYRALQP